MAAAIYTLSTAENMIAFGQMKRVFRIRFYYERNHLRVIERIAKCLCFFFLILSPYSHSCKVVASGDGIVLNIVDFIKPRRY